MNMVHFLTYTVQKIVFVDATFDLNFLEIDNVNNYYQQLIDDKNILEQELKGMKIENQLLKHNKRYIEKVAREEYFYIYPNEIIINLN